MNKSKKKLTNVVYISIRLGKLVVIDLATASLWANEYFTEVKEIDKFIKDNNLTLIDKQSAAG